MGYELLSKYYYTNRDLYDEEYEKRKNSINSINFDIDIKDNQAFAVITPEITKLLISIYKNNTILEKVYRELPKVAKERYFKNCMIDEIILTNDIEGVYSTRKEINEVLINVSEDKKLRFDGLVKKYRLLMEKSSDIGLKTCEDIRQLYDEIVLDEISSNELKPDGEIFRKDLAEVISATQQIKHKGIAPESKIIENVTKALYILNDTGEFSLINIAVFHYLIGYIHPFYDGNGRLNRFISSNFLSKELNSMIAYRLSYAIKADKNSYYKAFDVCNDSKNKGDLTYFVLMFLNKVNVAVVNLLEKVNDGYKKIMYFNNLIVETDTLKSSEANILFVLIQGTLFCNEGLTRTELIEATHTSYQTVTKTLSSMKSEGMPIMETYIGRQIAYSVDVDEVSEYLEKIKLKNK